MNTEQSRKAAHNKRVRAALLAKAAPLFREKGPDGVGIDEVMGRAGLTRGAFYAHFPSKEAVFLESLHQDTPLLQNLERRVSQDQKGLLAEMRGVFDNYLSPNNPMPQALRCTLAGLAMDVARGSEDARARHEAIQLAVRVEMARGQDVHHDDVIVQAAISLAVGTAVLAAAQNTEAGRAAVLKAGRAGVQDLLDGFVTDLPEAEPPVAPPEIPTALRAPQAANADQGRDRPIPPRPAMLPPLGTAPAAPKRPSVIPPLDEPPVKRGFWAWLGGLFR